MASFEVCKDPEYPEHAKRIRTAFDINDAVEMAAATICQEDAEYSDFECFARQVGETEWRQFHVTVESKPVFYASESS